MGKLGSMLHAILGLCWAMLAPPCVKIDCKHVTYGRSWQMHCVAGICACVGAYVYVRVVGQMLTWGRWAAELHTENHHY